MSGWTKCISKKERARQAKIRDRLRERLTQRITHNFNEMSPYELEVQDCMFLEEFLVKNPDIQINISNHRRSNEALEREEVRTTLVKIGNIFVGTPGYNWKLETSTLSIVPINFSEFHNAELAYIAIKSRRRSAYDLYKSRGLA